MSADLLTGKVREAPECPEQWSRRPQVRCGCIWVLCSLPPVDGNWTEQVPSIVLVGEDDSLGEARLWDCRTVETIWLTTHSHTHYPACHSEQGTMSLQHLCDLQLSCSSFTASSLFVIWSIWGIDREIIKLLNGTYRNECFQSSTTNSCRICCIVNWVEKICWF